MNESNIRPDRRLSEILSSAARFSTSPPNKGFLQECAFRAAELEGAEDELHSDVRAFHKKYGHPAPGTPTMPADDVLQFRIALIREECEELCEAIADRNLSAIASEAVDVLYVVIGTLVVCGLPLMPFWRNVQRANMAKIVNPEGGKPLKPEGWVGPDPRQVLYDWKSAGVDLSEPELW